MSLQTPSRSGQFALLALALIGLLVVVNMLAGWGY